MPLPDAGDGRHDLARGSIVYAQERVLVEESGLNRMERAILPCEPLDGGNRPALDLGGECEAGKDALPVDMHSAGTALALVAALLGASEADMVAQHIE